MEVFPEELLNKIFELSSNERIIAKLPLHKRKQKINVSLLVTFYTLYSAQFFQVN